MTTWFFPPEGGGSQRNYRPQIEQLVHEQEREIRAHQEQRNAIIRGKHVLESPQKHIPHGLEFK